MARFRCHSRFRGTLQEELWNKTPWAAFYLSERLRAIVQTLHNELLIDMRSIHIRLLSGAFTLFTLNACQKGTEATPDRITANETDAPRGEASVLMSGTFSGRNDHVVTGTAHIVEIEGSLYVELADDFNLDGAPDPQVGLGDGTYDPSTNRGQLEDKSGFSRYEINAAIDVEQYSERLS